MRFAGFGPKIVKVFYFSEVLDSRTGFYPFDTDPLNAEHDAGPGLRIPVHFRPDPDPANKKF